MYYQAGRKYRIVEFENGQYGFQYRDVVDYRLAQLSEFMTVAGCTPEPRWIEDPRRFTSPKEVKEYLDNINIKRVVEEL